MRNLENNIVPYNGQYPVTFDQFIGYMNNTPMQGNLIYAMILYAQARKETGNFTSPLFKQGNNLFGMKPSTMRDKIWTEKYTAQNGEVFAMYDSLLKSVLDRVDLDVYNNVFIPDEPNEVVGYMQSVLSKGYATDPNYLSSWLDLAKEVGEEDTDFDSDDLGNTSNSGLIWKIVVPIILIVIGYFVWKKFKK